MTLDGIIGNADVVRALKGMAESGRIPHSMMFCENDGCGAMQIVLSFLSDVFGDERKVTGLIHPDIHYVFPVASGTKVKEKTENLRASLFLKEWRDLMVSNPYALESEVNEAFGVEGKKVEINKAEAKEVLERINLTSVEGGWKAVVVYLPEKMNASAANSLLKAVEEPPEKTLFLMIAHAPEKVMQTIASRCQMFRLMPYSKEEIEQVLTTRFKKGADEARTAASVAGGSVGRAVHYLSDKEDYEEQMQIFRDLLNSCAAKDLLSALQTVEAMAGMSSREKQKAFCKFAGDGLRKIFLVQQNLAGIAGILPEEQDFYRGVAVKARKNFPRRASGFLDRAQMLIDRNVNQKILFTDLVNRMYISF